MINSINLFLFSVFFLSLSLSPGQKKGIFDVDMLRKLVPSSGDQDQLAAFVDRLPIGLIASGAELDRVD